jgi:hypothetical protein
MTRKPRKPSTKRVVDALATVLTSGDLDERRIAVDLKRMAKRAAVLAKAEAQGFGCEWIGVPQMGDDFFVCDDCLQALDDACAALHAPEQRGRGAR